MTDKREAIFNTSPLLYLHRAGMLHVLPKLFRHCATTNSVLNELEVGRNLSQDVPSQEDLAFLTIRDPQHLPASWLALDLGLGETSVIALAAEEKIACVVLDDQQARRLAGSAGLQVWGTLRIVLEAKQAGYISRISPVVDRFISSGMWISADVRSRILRLAGE